MYRTISIISFVIVIGGIIIHRLLRPCPKGFMCPLALTQNLISKFLGKELSLFEKFKMLIYLGAAVSFLVLLLTGFGSVVTGKSISGYLLMIHVTFAPVFAVCVALAALIWAYSCSFDGREETGKGVKITFWLVITLTLPIALSMILSMYPLFDTHWQEMLFDLHRISTLLLSVIALIHIYLVLRRQVSEE